MHQILKPGFHTDILSASKEYLLTLLETQNSALRNLTQAVFQDYFLEPMSQKGVEPLQNSVTSHSPQLYEVIQKCTLDNSAEELLKCPSNQCGYIPLILFSMLLIYQEDQGNFQPQTQLKANEKWIRIPCFTQEPIVTNHH